MTDPIKVAAVQTAFDSDRSRNIRVCSDMIREANDDGAQIVLLPELFEGPYFPQAQREELFSLAHSAEGHPTLRHFAELAAELEVVLPISFFERDGNSFYNSVAVIDADGAQLGVYRKSHIPDGPGYQEKFYFRPGNTGLHAFDTRYARIGVAICWDQWFPEAARCLALDGADILFYPTAIGSEPHDQELDTRAPWRRVMIGHAVANSVWVVAANRIGREQDIDFYGNSFVADHRGELVGELQGEVGIAMGSVDIEQMQKYRAGFGCFRDRRPELYRPIADPKR